MKHCKLVFIVILFLAAGCRKEITETSDVPDIGSGSILDTLASGKWVFTEYHDKVIFDMRSIHATYYMSIISDGNETASIGVDGKIFLKRAYDFKFADFSYFFTMLQPTSFVSGTYSAPYQDTANFNLVNNLIVLSKPVKYLPDTMAFSVDTACLMLSGMLHLKDYDVKRTIVLYKNKRWYGGYRNFKDL